VSVLHLHHHPHPDPHPHPGMPHLIFAIAIMGISQPAGLLATAAVAFILY